MKSKTYIIAWDGAIKNCINISQQLSYSNITHKFFNVSESPELTENWERKEDVRYYRHFFNAVHEFLETDLDVFIFNAGDGRCDDYANYTRYIEQVFSESPNLVAFAPDSTNDDWSGARSKIKDSSRYTNHYLTTCTNGIYFALSREMCEVLRDFYRWSSIESKKIDAEKMFSGWGIDLAISAYAIYNNKYCYRDRGLKLLHPPSSNYSTDAASKEGAKTMDVFSDYVAEVLGYDYKRFTSVYLKFRSLFFEPNSLKIEDFYSNPQEVENA
jgi:hypothetical protein